MTINRINYYSSLTPEFTPSYPIKTSSSLTPEFTPSCTIKNSSPFINMTLQPARKLKYNPKDTECEVLEDGNDD